MQTTIDDWFDLRSGDIINLKDQQTILQIMKEKTGDYANGANLAVREIQRFIITPTSGFMIIETDTNLNIVVKFVGSDFDVRVMFLPEGFPTGDRQDFKNADFGFMFSGEDFADIVTSPEWEFTPKNQTVYGKTGRKFAAVKEWKCQDAKCENPELIIFEIDGLNSSRGGWIKFYQGCNIALRDVEIFKETK